MRSWARGYRGGISEPGPQFVVSGLGPYHLIKQQKIKKRERRDLQIKYKNLIKKRKRKRGKIPPKSPSHKTAESH